MPSFVVDASLLAVVAAAAVLDLTTGKVPNGLTYPATALGLAFGLTLGGWWGLGESALGFAVAFVPLFVLYRMGAGLGGGDVKLLGAMGALGGAHHGWRFVIVVLLYSFIVATVMGLVQMVWSGRTRATFGRLGRTVKSVLIPGATVVSPSSPESVQVPFAVCVCLGVAWELIELALKRSLWDLLRNLAF
jgi:prepilin peptidase CpaA